MYSHQDSYLKLPRPLFPKLRLLPQIESQRINHGIFHCVCHRQICHPRNHFHVTSFLKIRNNLNMKNKYLWIV